MDLILELLLQLKQSCEVVQQQLEKFGDKIATMKKDINAAIDAAVEENSTAIENTIQESIEVEMIFTPSVTIIPANENEAEELGSFFPLSNCPSLLPFTSAKGPESLSQVLARQLLPPSLSVASARPRNNHTMTEKAEGPEIRMDLTKFVVAKRNFSMEGTPKEWPRLTWHPPWKTSRKRWGEWASLSTDSEEGIYAWVVANCGFGTLGGYSLQTTRIIEPDAWALDEKDPFMRPEEGESVNDIASILINTLEAMESELDGCAVLIVSHGEPLKILQKILNAVKQDITSIINDLAPRYVPQNLFIIITKTVSVEVYAVDHSKHPTKPPLDGACSPDLRLRDPLQSMGFYFPKDIHVITAGKVFDEMLDKVLKPGNDAFLILLGLLKLFITWPSTTLELSMQEGAKMGFGNGGANLLNIAVDNGKVEACVLKENFWVKNQRTRLFQVSIHWPFDRGKGLERNHWRNKIWDNIFHLFGFDFYLNGVLHEDEDETIYLPNPMAEIGAPVEPCQTICGTHSEAAVGHYLLNSRNVLRSLEVAGRTAIHVAEGSHVTITKGYSKSYEAFSKNLKLSIHKDPQNKTKLAELDELKLELDELVALSGDDPNINTYLFKDKNLVTQILLVPTHWPFDRGKGLDYWMNSLVLLLFESTCNWKYEAEVVKKLKEELKASHHYLPSLVMVYVETAEAYPEKLVTKVVIVLDNGMNLDITSHALCYFQRRQEPNNGLLLGMVSMGKLLLLLFLTTAFVLSWATTVNNLILGQAWVDSPREIILMNSNHVFGLEQGSYEGDVDVYNVAEVLSTLRTRFFEGNDNVTSLINLGSFRGLLCLVGLV